MISMQHIKDNCETVDDVKKLTEDYLNSPSDNFEKLVREFPKFLPRFYNLKSQSLEVLVISRFRPW